MAKHSTQRKRTFKSVSDLARTGIHLRQDDPQDAWDPIALLALTMLVAREWQKRNRSDESSALVFGQQNVQAPLRLRERKGRRERATRSRPVIGRKRQAG